MYAVEKLGSYITKGVYTVSGPFHPFGGAVDIIVVQQKDGSYKSSPWYVRFGKFQGVLKSKEKVVTICVNGEEAKFHMYLDNKGEAYFLKEWDFNDSGDSEASSSSSHSSGDEVEENEKKMMFKKVQSSNYDGGHVEKVLFVENEHEKIAAVENGNGNTVTMEVESEKIESTENKNGKNKPNENGNGKIVTRTRSKRAMLYQFMFGVEKMNENGKNTNIDTVEENEISANEVENENKESIINSEMTISNKEGTDDSLRTRVVTSEGIDDVNPCSSGDGNVEELKTSLKEDTETSRVNLDVVLENDDGEVKSIIHTETSETLTICTEGNGSISSTLLTETDTVIESCIEHDTDNLELSCAKVSCITQDLLSNSSQNGSNDVSPGKFCSSEHEIICVRGIEEVDSIYRNEMETSENGIKIKTSENLEEVQFQFSDVLGSVIEAEANGDDSNLLAEDTEKIVLEDRSNEECPPNISTPQDHTSPMDIPKNETHFEEADQLSTKSLPIIRSEIHDLDKTDSFHPLSCSLKLNNETLGSDSCWLSPNTNSATDFGNKQGLDASTVNSSHEQTESKQPLEKQDTTSSINEDTENGTLETAVQTDGSWRLWPFGLKKSKTIAVHPVPESATQENIVKSPMRSQSLTSEDDLEKIKLTKTKVSLAPTSEELASLNLNEGPNSVTFSFSTSMLGQQQVDARIYLWKWNSRIVISDVDGTITKSDVLGQFMPLVGKDWSQTGVAHLFSAIKENGYEFIFLSARSISQAYITRQFLMNLKQDGRALPDGPVVISPDGLFPSLYREVIRRAPHEFKISCLEDIKALFPVECYPFYAGFGNRDTDEFSYLKVGIPKGKIFIINPRGEVVVNRRVHDSGSYTSLHALVDGMFPPATAEVEDYNHWNFWKLPPPHINI